MTLKSWVAYKDVQLPEMVSVNGETSLGLVESCILRISISVGGKSRSSYG